MSFSFVILATFNCLLLTSALPVYLAASTAETSEQRPLAQFPSVYPHSYHPQNSDTEIVVKWMENNPDKISPGCFYSGYTITTSGKKVNAYDLLDEWADSPQPRIDCHLIFNIVDDSGANSEHVDWGVVSQTFAELVTGKVSVLLGETVSSDSIWLKDELPALEKNMGVSKPLDHWEVDKDGKLKQV